MIRDTVLSAAIAGAIAALALTILQAIWVTPLILKAEMYEQKAYAPSVGHSHHEHSHDAAEWKPHAGWQRTTFTFAANLLMGFGYAFLLISVYLLWRQPRNAIWGAIYGLAGFIVFFLAPAWGLPPELPGTAAAELTVRQQWWVMVAAATGVGLILLFSHAPVWARALGLLLIVTPHFFSAPQPEVAASLAPQDLQSRFQLATTLCNAVFWILLGLISSVAIRRK